MSWLCALWGRHGGAWGGEGLLPGCGASGVGHSPTPDCPPSGQAAGAHYPLAVGAGGCGRGDPSPTPQRALFRAGFACCGGGTRAPGGGPPAWVWGVRGRALSHPRLPAIWAGCRGPLPTGCGCGGLRAWGPVTNPTARALASWLCALWGQHEGAQGGAPPAWVWGVRCRALSHPRLPALWAGCQGPLPTGCGCGGVRAWGPVTNPTARALARWLCALWGRHEGARGGASCLGVGRPGSGALPPPTARHLGGLPGPTTHWLWVRGVAGVGTRHQPPSARSFELALRAMGAARGRPGGGGRLLPGCGASGVVRSPDPECQPSGRAAGAHYPLAVGAGGCGRGDPSQTPQRALLRAGFARCGGGMRVPGGAPRAWVWGVRGRALSHPRLPALWAGCWGPLLTGCGCGGPRAWGPVTNPTARALSSWLCMLWGRHEGACGGAPPAWVWGIRAGALSHPRLPALWAGCRGPLPTGCGCGGGAGVGTRHKPHSARSCELALRAVRAACGCPGGASCLGVGVRGRALSQPRLPAIWAGCRGPLPTGCGCGGLRAWGPVTNPTARALSSWLCVLWGRQEGALGGGGLLPGCGASGVVRSPDPECQPSGRAAGAHYPLAVCAGGCGRGDPSQTPQRALLRAGFARSGGGMRVPGGAPRAWVWGVRGRALSHPRLPALWAGCRGPLLTGCGCGGVRAWGPVTNPTARALSSWLCMLWGRHEGACGGGRASCLGVGHPGWGALPPPTARPLGGLPGPTAHWLWVRGGWGRGDPSQTPQRALLRGGFARCGGGMRVPGGAPLAWVWGSGVGRSPTPDCPPSGRAAGAHYPLAVGAGGCGRGDPSPTPQRALFRAGFARCGGGRRAPGGGRLLPGCGASGVGRSPTPDCPPSGRAAGAHYPLAVGAVGCRRGDLSQTPQRALLRAGFARCGGGMRVPGGAPLAWVWGVRGWALSHPRLPALLAGCRGPLPTGCGCGGARAWGLVTNTTARALLSWLCTLWGRHKGARGGASCLGVGRPVSGALPPPTARPLGGLPGPTTHWLWVLGGAGVGTRHQPHSARSFELALRAVGAARGRPGGRASCLGVGRPV